MQATRQRILTYLETHRRASATDLSRALGNTAANIRHHLARLVGDGYVEVIGLQKPISRGRPTTLYGLTVHAQRQDLDRLVGVLWHELIGEQPSYRRTTRLRRIARQLIGSSDPLGGSLTLRLTTAVGRLRDLSYQARWEAHVDGPRIILDHCPYAALQNKYPELCHLDACVVEELVGFPVAQVDARSPMHGKAPCIFQVQVNK